MVNDPRYTPSNRSVCQQMSLPLTYDDGISLLPKRCDQDESYFACDIPCKLHFIFGNQKKNATFHEVLNCFVRKGDFSKLCDRDSLSKIEIKLAITLSREKILCQRISLALNCYIKV